MNVTEGGKEGPQCFFRYQRRQAPNKHSRVVRIRGSQLLAVWPDEVTENGAGLYMVLQRLFRELISRCNCLCQQPMNFFLLILTEIQVCEFTWVVAGILCKLGDRARRYDMSISTIFVRAVTRSGDACAGRGARTE